LYVLKAACLNVGFVGAMIGNSVPSIITLVEGYICLNPEGI